MANSTIPNLVAVSVPALTDLLGVRQSGDSRDKKLTVTQLLSLSTVPDPLLLSDGTSGAPSYSFSNDSATGLYLQSVDFMDIVAKGTIVARVNGDDGALQVISGSLSIPGLGFRTDLDTGIRNAAADQLSLIAGGVEIARATEVVGANQFAIALSGASTVPELTSLGDPDTGFRWTGSNEIITVHANSRGWHFLQGSFFGENSDGPILFNIPASAIVPTICVEQSDSNTGLGHATSDALSLIAGAKEIARCQEVVGAEQFIVSPGFVENNPALPALAFGNADTGFFESTDNILKVSVGGAAQFQWNGSFFRAEASAGGGIANETASATNPTLVPSGGDQDSGIGSNAADQVSIIAGGVEGLRVIESEGGINVTAAGPVTVTGLITVSNAAGGVLRDEAATSTNPTFMPNKTDIDTGIGWAAHDQLSLVAGGAEGFRVTEAAAVITNTIFGNLVAAGGGGAGPMMKNEGPSSTNPVFVPNQADPDTGLTRSGVDRLGLIAGGLECLSVRETGGARQVGFYTTAPVSQSAAYSRAATIVESRALLASVSATVTNNNNVLAALIADLQATGLIG